MLPDPSKMRTSPSSISEGERKQVSVLFSDLTGFTALSEKLDPEETRQIMAGVFSRAADIVARYEGRIEKFIGDALMALFGVPAAHEDDPVRALRAALELHAAVTELAPGIEARSGVAVALHSGINTGVVVTGELRFGQGTAGPLGDTINLAARLMAAAPRGEIWVGAETRRLADAVFDFDDIGAQAFKGKAAPVAVARLRGRRSRTLAPARSSRGAFVGRHAELGAVLGAAEKVRDGEAQVLAVRGDAGTGKTRLFGEFRARAGADLLWLEGRAYPYAQNIPYAPLIDLLSREWGIEDTDRPDQVRSKIAAGAAAVLDSPADALQLLHHLFHLEQDAGVVIERESFKGRLLQLVRDLLAGRIRRGPVVACLQDLQWIDQSTDSLLRALVERPPPGVLLLVNFRPGYTPPPAMPVIELTELSARQTRELLASLLDGDAPEPLARFIAERSDGNPFYVEEVVNSLVETQALVHDAAGWRLARPLAEAGIPSTVRGVIAARIDRLDDVRRGVLRHAAVVGREFLYAVVAQVCDDVDTVAPSLTQLTSADLIRRHRDEPELEYIFKHALTQDVAYEGLLKGERQVLHARTARVIEAVLADRLPEFVETLAYHYLRGGVVDKAVHYLTEAGRKCVERYALAEAAAHFREAYAQLSAHTSMPGLSLAMTRLLNAWSQVYYYQGAIGEWLALLERHRTDAEACGDGAALAMYLGWLGNVRQFHGDLHTSLEVLDRALAVGTAADAREALSYVSAWRSFTLRDLSRLREAIESANLQGHLQADPKWVAYPVVKSVCGGALAMTLSGEGGLARAAAERLVRAGQSSGSARAEALGRAALSVLWSTFLDFDRAVEEAEAGALAAKAPLFAAINQANRAMALIASMRAGECLAVCHEWLPLLLRQDNLYVAALMKPAQASATMLSGHFSQGLRQLQAIVRASRAGQTVASNFVADITLAVAWVGIARREVKPALSVLLRNPWFTFTQAPYAARRAAAAIAKLRADITAAGHWGQMNLVDLADGRLQVHLGKVDAARECLARIDGRRCDAGLGDRPKAVQGLADEIASRAAGR